MPEEVKEEEKVDSPEPETSEEVKEEVKEEKPKGLIGKRVGESVEVQTPRGPHPYEIISISVYNG